MNSPSIQMVCFWRSNSGYNILWGGDYQVCSLSVWSSCTPAWAFFKWKTKKGHLLQPCLLISFQYFSPFCIALFLSKTCWNEFRLVQRVNTTTKDIRTKETIFFCLGIGRYLSLNRGFSLRKRIAPAACEPKKKTEMTDNIRPWNRVRISSESSSDYQHTLRSWWLHK